MVYVFFADGFEELEALTPVDVLRRAGVAVKTVGVTGTTVIGSHEISINCDITCDKVNLYDLDGIILPGGMPGTVNLEKDEKVSELIDYAAENNKIIGAICAAPSILGHKGLLQGKNAVCFTGFEKELVGAHVLDRPAVRDGNIVTGWGAGGAVDFALLYLEAISESEELAKKTARKMRCVSY
ncbi:MAG: DJ-1 family glyoxalase III [Acutalibacteraceae bacterium]|nr:DJ-1 family glyoxalase III [Acutalibacteraceae bacterium]